MSRAEALKERSDHRIICDMVGEGESVLDLGCANGDLMTLLVEEKRASVQGIELDAEAVHRCVEMGLTVFQGDIESGLADYPARSFDCVVLNQSIQEVKNVDFILGESLRVGRRAIVGFPNFAYIRARCSLFFAGKTPVTDALPHLWHETPNVRFFSIRDFEEFCRRKGLRILRRAFIGMGPAISCFPNLFARKAVYQLTGMP